MCIKLFARRETLIGVLFVPGIKRNLVSISALEENGYRVIFMDGKVLAWPKNSTIKKGQTIGTRQGYLYKLCTESDQALIYGTSGSNEIWHRRLGQLCPIFYGKPSYRSTQTKSKSFRGMQGVCLGEKLQGVFSK